MIGIRHSEKMYETLLNNEKCAKAVASDILEKFNLKPKKYILLGVHKKEIIDTEKVSTSLFNAINCLSEKYDMPILYFCHPRSRNRLESSGFKLDESVIRHEPLELHGYNKLQMNAFASDSEALPEESCFFSSIGKLSLHVASEHLPNAPKRSIRCAFILAGNKQNELLQAVTTVVDVNENGDCAIPVPDCIEENVSKKV